MTAPLASAALVREILADQRVESFDCGIAPDDEPWPTTVPLDEALRAAALDDLCRSCGSRNCTGCPSNPRG